ncbi:DUF934 domain-containing protein [Marinobacterium mangrovicola]|uniref:Uncharacterized protein (DUF934 family) n=1 Tax=Marinobacterium mangrovicola TaxID=1476959 RepID=A0A4R1GP20_9GAMM|nr:DUF934 domain-containing protein [Marinobacterium mangrovicola]TCK09141.1 uncharacterized protein (DUF934 family) [Marinobacterium mangrovicola]
MNNTLGMIDGVATHLVDDDWVLVDDEQERATGGKAILSLERWKKRVLVEGEETDSCGVLLGPDDELEEVFPWIDRIPLIALQFPSFRDGRAYSQANLLRTRYKFKGDLRAVGDVLRDQLALMRHCGFSSFVVREDKSVADALKGLEGFDLIYAGSAANPEPLFRRRGPGS